MWYTNKTYNILEVVSEQIHRPCVVVGIPVVDASEGNQAFIIRSSFLSFAFVRSLSR